MDLPYFLSFIFLFMLPILLLIYLGWYMMRITIDDGRAKIAWLAWIPIFNIYLMEHIADWNRNVLHVIVGFSLITVVITYLEAINGCPNLGFCLMILSALWIPTLIYMLVEVNQVANGIHWWSMIAIILATVCVVALLQESMLLIIVTAWVGVLWYMLYELIKHRATAIVRIITPCIIWILLFIPLKNVIDDAMRPRRSAWENRSKLTLRALGSSELAFAKENDNEFGTWDEMTKAEFIQIGYSRTNMIDNYSLIVFEISKSTRDDDNNILVPSTFTMIAIPRSQKNRLRTFAFGDDQTPRIWVGSKDAFDPENIALRDIKLWEPLR